MFTTGLAKALGEGLARGLDVRTPFGLVVLFTFVAVLVSEATSNTASATMVVPLAIGVAQGAGVDPLPPAIAACLGASMGSALPVSTPPNAIVYGSGLRAPADDGAARSRARSRRGSPDRRDGDVAGAARAAVRAIATTRAGRSMDGEAGRGPASANESHHEELRREDPQDHREGIDRRVRERLRLGVRQRVGEGERRRIGHAAREKPDQSQVVDPEREARDNPHDEKGHDRDGRAEAHPGEARASHQGRDEAVARLQAHGREEEHDPDLAEHEVGADGHVRDERPDLADPAEHDGDEQRPAGQPELDRAPAPREREGPAPDEDAEGNPDEERDEVGVVEALRANRRARPPTFWMSASSPTASTVSPYWSTMPGAAFISTSARLTRVICTPKRRAKSSAAMRPAERAPVRHDQALGRDRARQAAKIDGLSRPTITRRLSSSSFEPTARSTSPRRRAVSGWRDAEHAVLEDARHDDPGVAQHRHLMERHAIQVRVRHLEVRASQTRRLALEAPVERLLLLRDDDAEGAADGEHGEDDADDAERVGDGVSEAGELRHLVGRQVGRPP